MKNTIHMLKSVTNTQMMSFVITTEDGKVILIDGGWRQDAAYLLEYLRTLTGQAVPHVDAIWLTHPHSDHILAFLELLDNHRDDFTFDKVYYHFPSVRFIRQEDNDYPTLEAFYAHLPLFADKINIVSGGDAYDFGAAHVEVLYSTDDAFRHNVCNNASVVFRLTLAGKRILFTGDCGVEAGRKILRLVGADGLKSDFCQMAHHGQNGCDRAFYEAVAPDACFWCAPDWLWDNNAGKGFNTHIFKTVEVRGWMQQIGVSTNYVIKDGTQVVEL